MADRLDLYFRAHTVPVKAQKESWTDGHDTEPQHALIFHCTTTAEEKQELSVRLEELERLAAGVAAQERAARSAGEPGPDEEIVRHALERLEAALRARTAAGLG